MVGMILSGAPAATKTHTTRTFQSGGSLGGVKKSGTIIIGNWPRIAPGMMVRTQHSVPTVRFMLSHTTRNPFQKRRNGYYSPVLG